MCGGHKRCKPLNYTRTHISYVHPFCHFCLLYLPVQTCKHTSQNPTVQLKPALSLKPDPEGQLRDPEGQLRDPDHWDLSLKKITTRSISVSDHRQVRKKLASMKRSCLTMSGTIVCLQHSSSLELQLKPRLSNDHCSLI